MSSTPDRRSKRPPVRGKYAKAFDEGVKVIVHSSAGDQTRIVRRNAAGEIEWQDQQKPRPKKAG